ncbi:MAG TPA: bifunctional [glutamate--ammonia ligase]-adenylyl-L-tyrosine phosphorylase/[glutamate--ammonia-ligase] adenylyltransferase [Mariprofundaceae bacterium]|nr:bifunctional [glutamate--ammonia ligase]-adenylyl-L-tyrosine phosphorylase/[glutamate--ammonia-ligase] adenylyltransferase [Mariprofundaceae bacterium]
MPLLNHVPVEVRDHAQRLLDISPLFGSLMRDADESTCLELFRSETDALLPDGSEAWVPASASEDVTECMRNLRQSKQRGMRHIIWWEMGVHGDIERSCTAIADFAAGLLDQALRMAERLIAPRFGRLEGGAFCVIGLGKLGGRELNLGSDVDPLFIWQGEGNSEGGRKNVPAAEYFNHLSRMLIRLMSERTEDGIVWPVDMRLRPGGEGAAISLSLDATLDFYQNYGQTWERAMLIKARPVAGDMALGNEFVSGVSPFIYRRYLDYTTVSALAEMKRRIDNQAGEQAFVPGFDVKRGQGGIREIEFIIQSVQLLHGGGEPCLRLQGSLDALRELTGFGALDADEAGRLADAYRFWRRVEHAIQARVGEQTQKLPEQFESYLRLALGHPDITTRMQEYAGFVQQAFHRHVLPLDAGKVDESWLPDGQDSALKGLDGESLQRIRLALEQIDAQLLRGILPERSRRHIETILAHAMPRWLDDANGITAIEAFTALIHGIAGRATWIDLLATHKGALDWLIGVLSASRYLADHIAQDPSWLEWPLALERRDTDIAGICEKLDALAIAGGSDDIEQTLADVGRLVDRARILTALAIDSHEASPLDAGAWLAMIADSVTAAMLRLCCRQMKLPVDFPMAALAMGKHGSREMGLMSDLDMVFVLVCEDTAAMVAGRSYTEQAQRLGRRMIQYLTGKPPFGAGFEFDARLRPSGNSGVLVTSLKGFRDYQLHEAQTWEHQALCRARTVAGPGSVCKAVTGVVDEILNLSRDPARLATDVAGMRQKMLDHLASKSDEIINLKHDAGGLVDIEFLAQFARLAYGDCGHGTVEILRRLAAMSVPEGWQQHCEFLADTYLDYRQMENALRVELWRSIGKLPTNANATEWETMRRHAAIHSPQSLKDRMQEVRRLFSELLG